MWILITAFLHLSTPDLGMITKEYSYTSFDACHTEQLSQVAEWRDLVLDGTYNAVCVEKN